MGPMWEVCPQPFHLFKLDSTLHLPMKNKRWANPLNNDTKRKTMLRAYFNRWRRVFVAKHHVLLLLFLCCVAHVGYGQRMQRVYAIDESHGGTLLTHFVNSEDEAVDGIPSTHSTIGVNVIGEVWQRLQFPSTLAAGTTVRVKIGTVGNILDLLGSIQIQAYQNSNPRGSSYSIASLISLLAGEDQAEIVFTPTESFNSVRIYSSGVRLDGGLKIYEAYYLIPAAPNIIACDISADVLYGSTGSIAGGLNAIDNPYNAIDDDLTSFTTMRANVSAAGNRTHLTALYNTISQDSDSIRIVLRRPGALLDANLLSDNLRVRTLLDNTDNGYLLLDPEFLSLRLLASDSDVQVLTYPIETPFNRIEISLGGGLLNALQVLDVFEIQRVMAKPVLTALNIQDGVVTICEGDGISLSVENPETGNNYYWYTDETALTPIHTGVDYTATPTGTGNFFYYVSRSREGCTEESDRAVIKINVLPLPGKPHLTISDVIN